MQKKEDFFYLEQLLMKINEQCIKSFFGKVDNKDAVIFEKLPVMLKIILTDLKKNKQLVEEDNKTKNEVDNFLYNRGFSFKYIEDDEFESIHEAEMQDMKKQYLNNILKTAYNNKNNLEKDCVDDDDYFCSTESVDFLSMGDVDINNPYAKLISASKANGVPMRVSFIEAVNLFNNVKDILDSNMGLDKIKKSLEHAFAEYELYF